ncbi:MAG: hypothetical protein Q8P18_15860 [Pseudomonadota bacterium]|nr:hypothetical protein [Pseudomonadota bacterium]
MDLFPDRLVSDLERLPGAGHSYLKQLCAPDGTVLRAGLERVVSRLGEPMRGRASELLSSLENRRFFQGFAEVAALASLEPAGWRATGLCPPGPRIEITRVGGALSGAASAPMLLSVLAFLHQTRPGGEEETRRRLIEALARVSSRQRFGVLVRRWLPHDFNPEPVRRAIELWLGQVANGQWEGRYAAYEDEHISLEFCLTGERAKARQSPVALTLGPFYAHRTLEVLEPRVVAELDRHVASAERNLPLLIACAADQPWAVNEGYLRDFLYGRARRISREGGVREVEFSGSGSVSVFRDPLYASVAGLLLVDRRPTVSMAMGVRAWLNPWATHRLTPADIPFCCFAEDVGCSRAARALPPLGGEAAADPGGASLRVMRWHEGSGPRMELG